MSSIDPQLTAQLIAQMTEWRRHMHRFPECGFEVQQTSEFIAEKLEGAIPENGSRHVVVARLGGVDAGFRAGCHILIDDRPVGGDLHKELLF